MTDYTNESEWPTARLIDAYSAAKSAKVYDCADAIRAELDRRADAAEARVRELEAALAKAEARAASAMARWQETRDIPGEAVLEIEGVVYVRRDAVLATNHALAMGTYGTMAKRNELRFAARALLEALPRCNKCQSMAITTDGSVPVGQLCAAHTFRHPFVRPATWAEPAEALRKVVG